MNGNTLRFREADVKSNIQRITKPALRRLARRGGVKRINGNVYDETRSVLTSFLESLLKDAVAYTDYRQAQTVTTADVLQALRHQGRTLYGYGDEVHKKTRTVSIVPKSLGNTSKTPTEISKNPKTPEDPYFGDLKVLQERLRAKNTDINILTPAQFLQDPDAWWKATDHIRKTGVGCPMLALDLLRKGIEENPTYRIYNFMTTWPRRKGQGIAAFLILRTEQGKVEIDYACSFEKVKGIMKIVVKTLQEKQPRLQLKAVLTQPSKGVRFWWKRGFRTRISTVDAYLEKNQGDFRTSALMKLLTQHDPSLKDTPVMDMYFN